MQLQIQMIEMKFWWFIYSVRCRNHNGNLSNMGKFKEPVNLLDIWTEQFWHQLNEAEMKIFAFDNAEIEQETMNLRLKFVIFGMYEISIKMDFLSNSIQIGFMNGNFHNQP